MTRVFSKLALPLLAKELTERAARKWTYGVRVLFAALLMIAFSFLAYQFFSRSSANPLSILGQGSRLFDGLIAFQLIGIFLFVPAMTASQITFEKERDSLALLFLTRLSPWQIILEKYLSALIPIFSLLLVAMPMTAIAYAYGGVTQEKIGLSIYMLMLTALQIAAFSLLCSARCRTTVGAFLSTYFLGTLIYFSPTLTQEIMRALIGHNFTSEFLKWMMGIFPPENSSSSFRSCVKGSVPALISIPVFLGLARFFLVRRAFVKGTNPALLLFRWMDRLMQRANKLAGNVSFGKSEINLPTAQPIAWREMRRNVLARPHYLLRILLAVEVPTVIFGLVMLINNEGRNLPWVSAILGTLAVLAISVNAANAFVSERVNQTLDLLLTTPISARQIVKEKAQAMRRFLLVAAVPLMSLFLMEWSMQQNTFHFQSFYRSSNLYLVCSILTLAIYLPLVSWLSLWIGLKAKTRFRAIVTALVVIILWCALPIVLGVFSETLFGSHTVIKWGWLMSCSPIFVPALNETYLFHSIISGNEWLVVLFNFTFYSVILALIRWRCLRRADVYLRQA